VYACKKGGVREAKGVQQDKINRDKRKMNLSEMKKKMNVTREISVCLSAYSKYGVRSTYLAGSLSSVVGTGSVIPLNKGRMQKWEERREVKNCGVLEERRKTKMKKRVNGGETKMQMKN
jgi:hypothetical protein